MPFIVSLQFCLDHPYFHKGQRIWSNLSTHFVYIHNCFPLQENPPKIWTGKFILWRSGSCLKSFTVHFLHGKNFRSSYQNKQLFHWDIRNTLKWKHLLCCLFTFLSGFHHLLSSSLGTWVTKIIVRSPCAAGLWMGMLACSRHPYQLCCAMFFAALGRLWSAAMTAL